MFEEREIVYLSGYELCSPTLVNCFSGSIYNENIENGFCNRKAFSYCVTSRKWFLPVYSPHSVHRASL